MVTKYTGPSSAQAYASFKAWWYKAHMPTDPATLPANRPTAVSTSTSCPAGPFVSVAAGRVTTETQTSRFSQASTYTAFTAGQFFYRVWGGTTSPGSGDGEVYVQRQALDPCAQHQLAATEAFVQDPESGEGSISVTGSDGTDVSFQRARGAAGHLNVATGAWS